MYGYDGDLTYKPEMFIDRAKLIEKQQPGIEEECKLAEQRLTLADPTNGEELKSLMKAKFDAMARRGNLRGCKEQADQYTEKCNEMIRETGQALLSRQEFEFNAAKANEELEKIRTQISRLDGQLDYLWRSFEATKDVRAMTQFAIVAREQHRLGELLGEQQGKMEENMRWLKYADGKYKAAGGEKSLAAFEHAQEFAAQRNGLF